MIKQLGTPKTLESAIERAYNGPMNEIKGVLRDYLAQHFCVAYLETTNPAQEKLLGRLWHLVTGESGFPPK